MAHGDAREGKRSGNWRMEWTASTLHTTSEHGVFGITTADAHTSAASSRLNWRPRRFKLTRLFRRKTRSGFCACAITFQLASNTKFWNTVFEIWGQKQQSSLYMAVSFPTDLHTSPWHNIGHFSGTTISFTNRQFYLNYISWNIGQFN
jgi:hypothetical protein